MWLTSLVVVIGLWAHSYRPWAAWIPYDVQRRLDPVTQREVRCTSYRGSVQVIVVTPETQREAASTTLSHADWKWLGLGYHNFRLYTSSLWDGEVHLPWPTQVDREAPAVGRRFHGSGLVQNPRTVTVIALPYWLMCSIVAGPAAVVAARRAKRRCAMRHGLCPTCGYDLRASANVCPECGASTGRADQKGMATHPDAAGAPPGVAKLRDGF
jgi:hypothetical protein